MRNLCPCGKGHNDVEACDKLDIAHEALRLRTRVHELEKTRDEMQTKRDQAIAERRDAEAAVMSLVELHPMAMQIDAAPIQPGSLVILRAEGADQPKPRAALDAIVRWLAARHPEWTLLLTSPTGEIRVEDLPPAKMRVKGWVRVERSTEVLEQACRAYRAALRKGLMLFESMGGQAPLEAVSREISTYVGQVGEMLRLPLPVASIEEGN